MTIAVDPADDKKTVDAIEEPTGTSIQLERDKAYRVISNVGLKFKMSMGTLGSPMNDGAIYLPADTAVVLRTTQFDTITTVKVGATDGFVNCVEIQ
jgi:hypothetical protein